MITDIDITKLKTIFATKEELGDLRLEMGEMHDKIDMIADKVVEMDAKFDRTLGALDNERVENAVQAIVMGRHERQIQALAKGTGVAIPLD